MTAPLIKSLLPALLASLGRVRDRAGNREDTVAAFAAGLLGVHPPEILAALAAETMLRLLEETRPPN